MTTARHIFSPAELRSSEILQSVRKTFAEKGFDGASMQDLARAAGISVGNFYRYFPSKAAIVQAMIEFDLAEIEQDFGRIIAAPHPLDALRSLLHFKVGEHQCSCEKGQLWAEITATALRKPEIGSVAGNMETAILGYLTRVFAAATGLAPEEAARRFTAQAAFIIILFKSTAMIPQRNPALASDLTDLLLRTIDQTLDDIASNSPEV